MKIYYIILIGLFFSACRHQEEMNLLSIEILYYNGWFIRADAVRCEEITYSKNREKLLKVLDDGYVGQGKIMVLDTILTNKNVLQEIITELNKVEYIKEDNIDPRMKCYLNYKNGETDSLCIDTNLKIAIYNNKPIKFSNKLLYLLRKNCGFYSWINLDQLQHFEELNDTSFKREKVKDFWGEKY